MSTKFATQKRAIIAAAMAVILLVGLMVPTVSAYAEPTSAEKRAEAQQVLSQLEEMQVKLDEASNNYYIKDAKPGSLASKANMVA